jgi:cytochrome c-type biogenesis protein CcmH
MTLWAILTIMTSAAAVLLAAPFLRRLDRPRDTSAADPFRPRSLARFSPDKQDFAAVTGAGIILLGSACLYALNGGANLPAMPAKVSSLEQPGTSVVDALAAATLPFGVDPLSQNLPEPGLGTVDEMIARLVERLNRNPGEPDGWRMLGWSYFNTDRFAQSAAAYAKAVELDPENADFRSSRGEALVRAANGLVTDEARSIFEQVLRLDAKDPRARFFLGLAKEQSGNKPAALDDWVAILNETDSSSPWFSDLSQHVTELGQETGIDFGARLRRGRSASPDTLLETLQQQGQGPAIAAPNNGGPTPEDVRAAETMKPADRLAMIQAMLDRLASRLQQSPRDIEGWIKLIRSRQTLGQVEAAGQTVQSALEAFKDSPQEQERISSAARELGLMQ